MEKIGLATQTMFAELLTRCMDAEFDETYDERGAFVKKRSKGHLYWHHQRKVGGKLASLYVGPVSDTEITERVNRFSEIKSDFKGRQEMVRALAAAGLPSPDPIAGKIVEAIWKAGFFRLRGVLIGTVAYQAYAGLLGAKLTGVAIQTQDADFAQFWGISQSIGESMPPILDVLRSVDASFREMPDINDPFVTTRYSNAQKYKVEFLTPNRGSEDFQGKPAKMRALGGSGAQPLRHLDFLIYRPEKSVLLYGGGVPVTIPRAERYAIHKLIVAAARENQAKAGKDVMQAATLIDILSELKPAELAESWNAAWVEGPKWRAKLESGRLRLPKSAQATLEDVLRSAKASDQHRATRTKSRQRG